MKAFFIIICSSCICCLLQAQVLPPDSLSAPLLEFISDTQEPMRVERLYLAATQNTRATSMIYGAMLRDKPAAIFMLGDVVSLGYKSRKWTRTDLFLDSARNQHTRVYGLLGNHDVMFSERRGERNFNKRFPEHRHTGYLQTVDSLAIVMLNSNFSKLTTKENEEQQKWYNKTIDSLNNDPGTLGIIVTCHHPVFTNSNIVKPSAGVRQQFLPGFLATKKCILYITGHAHAFEHFKYKEKNFLIVGGGGGLHQPLSVKADMPADLAAAYKPFFHYLQLRRYGHFIQLRSRALKPDFSGFDPGYSFMINL